MPLNLHKTSFLTLEIVFCFKIVIYFYCSAVILILISQIRSNQISFSSLAFFFNVIGLHLTSFSADYSVQIL